MLHVISARNRKLHEHNVPRGERSPTIRTGSDARQSRAP